MKVGGVENGMRNGIRIDWHLVGESIHRMVVPGRLGRLRDQKDEFRN
jgi:hypothetical protein